MIAERLRILYTQDGDTVTCWRTVHGIATPVRVRLAFIDARLSPADRDRIRSTVASLASAVA